MFIVDTHVIGQPFDCFAIFFGRSLFRRLKQKRKQNPFTFSKQRFRNQILGLIGEILFVDR